MVHLGDVSPSIWDQVVEIMEEKLKHIEFQEEDIAFNWRIAADSKRLDRELYEIYGVFKDIILHPKFQYCKQFLEDNVNFDFVVGEPMMPVATAVIVLFMMYKRVSVNIIALAAAFIFNVNPFYVCLVVLTWYFTQGASKKPKMNIAAGKNRVRVKDTLVSKDPILFSEDIDIAAVDYDHVLVGNDLSTLYAAALLAKNGHKCCVLQPKGGPQTSHHPEGAPCAMPTVNSSVGKVERYQSLLDIVQSRDRSLRVSFSPVGTAADCFTHTVLRVAGSLKSVKGASHSVWPLRAGQGSISSDLCGRLHSDKQTLHGFMQSIMAVQASVTGYLITKIGITLDTATASVAAAPLPAAGMWGLGEGGSTGTPSESMTQFKNLCTSSVEQILSMVPDLDQSLCNVLSAACTVGAEEALSAQSCSGYALAALLSNSEQGMFYPRGGYGAIEGALVRAIRIGGGQVYSQVPIKGVSMGVRLGVRRAVGVEVNRGVEHSSPDSTVRASLSVISGVGALCTYTRLVPPSAVSDATREALSQQVESRPKVQVLVWIEGSADELGLSSTDYVEVGSQPQSSLSSTARRDAQESFAGSHLRVWSPSAKDPLWGTGKSSGTQCIVVELESGEPLVELKRTAYSAPHENKTAAPASPVEHFLSTQTKESAAIEGPSLFQGGQGGQSDTTNFLQSSLAPGVCHVGYYAPMSKSQIEKAKAKALSKIHEIYPLTEGKEPFCHVVPPTLGGHRMSGVTAKFNTPNLTATSDIPGLFLCGRDISTTGLAGDIQGGWMAANAVLGYEGKDLLGGRNIATDLQKMKR